MKMQKILRWNFANKISTFLSLVVIFLLASCTEDLEDAVTPDSKKSSVRVAGNTINTSAFLTQDEYKESTTAVHYTVHYDLNFDGGSSCGGRANANVYDAVYHPFKSGLLLDNNNVNKSAKYFRSIVIAPHVHVKITMYSYVDKKYYDIVFDNRSSYLAKYVPNLDKYKLYPGADYCTSITSKQTENYLSTINTLVGFTYQKLLSGGAWSIHFARLPIFMSTPLNETMLNSFKWNDVITTFWINPGGPSKNIAVFENNYDPKAKDTSDPGYNYKVTQFTMLSASRNISTIIPDQYYLGDEDYAISAAEVSAMNLKMYNYILNGNPNDGYSNAVISAQELQICHRNRNYCRVGVDIAEKATEYGFGSTCVNDWDDDYDTKSFDFIGDQNTTFWGTYVEDSFKSAVKNVGDGAVAAVSESFVVGPEAVFACVVSAGIFAFAANSCQYWYERCLYAAAPKKVNLKVYSIKKNPNFASNPVLTRSSNSLVASTFQETHTDQAWVFESVKSSSGVSGYVIKNILANTVLRDVVSSNSTETPYLVNTTGLPPNNDVWKMETAPNESSLKILVNVGTGRYLTFHQNGIRTITYSSGDRVLSYSMHQILEW